MDFIYVKQNTQRLLWQVIDDKQAIICIRELSNNKIEVSGHADETEQQQK